MLHAGRFDGRKVLVTGAGTGIGREIALEFAREGADVALHFGPHSDAGAASAVEEIRAMGRRAGCFGADFRDLDSVTDVANRAVGFLGGLNCLVNNAGITLNKPFLKATPQQFDTLFDVNVRAQYFLTQHLVPHMLAAGGGAVCNLSSVHGLQAAPEHSIYAATKGAIIAYTRVLGVELAHKGIRVNAIAPGWIIVEGHAKAVPGYTVEGAWKEASEKVPAGRPGLPLTIAKLAVFLCSDDADFIVGQTIVADGGTTSLMSLMTDFRSESRARFGTGYVEGV